MILITLGTISFPFDRAVLWLRILLNSRVISEPVFLQSGNSDISVVAGHPLVTIEPIVTTDKLSKLVNESRLVISHAGQGTTRMLAANGVQFILLPRLKVLGEHIDDHQLLFTQAIAKFGINSCVSLEYLQKLILEPPPSFKGQLFSEPKLAKYLLNQYPPEKQMTQLVS
ncbi:MAG: glycosyltransferase [Rhizonema sp. PD37]|nr:glycosyltransferase [Rhizonema sp. PD37]